MAPNSPHDAPSRLTTNSSAMPYRTSSHKDATRYEDPRTPGTDAGASSTDVVVEDASCSHNDATKPMRSCTPGADPQKKQKRPQKEELLEDDGDLPGLVLHSGFVLSHWAFNCQARSAAASAAVGNDKTPSSNFRSFGQAVPHFLLHFVFIAQVPLHSLIKCAAVSGPSWHSLQTGCWRLPFRTKQP